MRRRPRCGAKVLADVGVKRGLVAGPAPGAVRAEAMSARGSKACAARPAWRSLARRSASSPCQRWRISPSRLPTLPRTSRWKQRPRQVASLLVCSCRVGGPRFPVRRRRRKRGRCRRPRRRSRRRSHDGRSGRGARPRPCRASGKPLVRFMTLPKDSRAWPPHTAPPRSRRRVRASHFAASRDR
jgi:hypothetical protein